MKKNYFGIFDCYSPGRFTETLVMSGDFTCEELYKINKILEERINEDTKMVLE